MNAVRNIFGQVRPYTWTVAIDNAAAYAAGDVLAITTGLTLLESLGSSTPVLLELTSVVVLDKANQKAGIDLVFLEDNTSIGTINDAVGLTDANLPKVQGVVRVAAGDYIELKATDNAAAAIAVEDLPLKSEDGKLYVGLVTRGTPTYATGELVIKLGLRAVNRLLSY